MEQELEEEEEVDPRIQVGRAGGAPDPGLARAAAEIGIHTYTRLAAPSACGPGWGCWRRRSGGKKRGAEDCFTGFIGRLQCPHGCGLNILRGSPRRPRQNLGIAAACPAVGRMCNKGKKGAGAPRGYPGYPGQARHTAGIARPPGPGRRGRPPGGRCPPLQRGLALVPWVPSPHLVEVPGLSPSFLSFDCNQTEGFFFSFFLSLLIQPSTWPQMI